LRVPPSFTKFLLTALVVTLNSQFHATAQSTSPVTLFDLNCEYARNPIGIGASRPRLSWKLSSRRIGEVQTAYEIRAASSANRLKENRADLWESGKVMSDQSIFVPWAGKPLGSRSRVVWQVRIWDKDGAPTDWSKPAHFELGLLQPEREWKARWITADLPRIDVMASTLTNASWINAGSGASQAAAVRFVVNLPTNSTVASAAIHAAADSLITIYVNSQATRQGSTSRTAPLYADVRTQLKPGRNVVAIHSAAVRTAIRRDRSAAGRNAIAAHGLIELHSGDTIEFDTDHNWQAATDPAGDWFAPDYDDTKWAAASTLARYGDQPSKYCDNTIGAVRYLRKSFTAGGNIIRARLYATALGVHEATINGQRVGDTRFDPGWTDYHKRAMVQALDVTDLVKPGKNAVGVMLSDGWYAGRVGWMGLAQYGSQPVFAGQLELTYEDGSVETVITDETWRTGPGEIVGSDLQWGEIIDARQAVAEWNQPSFDASKWGQVMVGQHQLALDPQRGPPVRQLLQLAPQSITRRADKWIVDLGQNLVGVVRLRAQGNAGTTMILRHGEMLAPDGSLYTENLRTALATDTFILRGAGSQETFEPRFTFHGFRYVEVSGYPGVLSAEDIRGLVMGSDTPQTGTWECSDPELNRLYQNILWSQRGNFLSVPTDCPQRDERMGWLGDALVFAPTATRNADVSGFFSKWMVDVNDAQLTNGGFTTVAPHANQRNSWPVWGDAGVIIPWTMYLNYGDKSFLANNYEPMKEWVEHCHEIAKDLILSGGVGDHLAPAYTPVSIVDTAYSANSARILSKTAALLGKPEDAARFQKLSEEIAAAFNQSFVGDDGSITGVGGLRRPGGSANTRTGDTQTAYILALKLDLLPEKLRPIVARRLVAEVEAVGHLTTGFVGVGLICPTLTEIGRSDLAWKLAFTDTYPSWLFSVKNGATTIWERWDGWTPEKGFQASSMNSFNHYSFGSVGEWFYSGAAGIQIDERRPGYKHFFLRPQLTARLKYVKATQDSPYGQICSHWYVDGNQMHYETTVPPNTSATLELPGRSPQELAAGPHHFSLPLDMIK